MNETKPIPAPTTDEPQWTRFQGTDVFGNRRVFFAKPGNRRTEVDETPVIQLLLSGSQIIIDDQSFAEGIMSVLSSALCADILCTRGYVAILADDDAKNDWAITWLRYRGYTVEERKEAS